MVYEAPPYWTSPDKGEFEVSIESVCSIADYFHVQIDKDVIRPAGGGQAGEKGQLIIGDREVSVIDTVSTSDGTFLVTDAPLIEGETGLLKIDLVWRTSLMRNHTAEHIFVALIKRKFEDIAVGELWIDGRHGSVELLGTELDLDSIFKTESEVMKVIEDDLSVESGFEASDSISPSVRSREGLSEKHDQLRIVSVGDMDASACSGIHVSRTGEIGFFKVLDIKKSENKTRVEFAAGMEVAHHVSRFYNEALRRKYTYPFEMEQLGSVLDRAKLAIDDKQKMVEKTTQLLSRGPTVEQISEISFRHEILPGFDASSLRNLSNQLPTKGAYVTLLFAPDRKSQVVLRANEMPKDASDYISKPLHELGGLGGGKGDVFTGGFTDVADPMKLYEELVAAVRKLLV